MIIIRNAKLIFNNHIMQLRVEDSCSKMSDDDNLSESILASANYEQHISDSDSTSIATTCIFSRVLRYMYVELTKLCHM